jgi:excisionase family DNA binding protein
MVEVSLLYLDESSSHESKLERVMAEGTLLTVDDVARRLIVHADTVRNWIKSGELVAIDLGGRAGYRITQEALDEFLKKRQGRRE